MPVSNLMLVALNSMQQHLDGANGRIANKQLFNDQLLTSKDLLLSGGRLVSG